MTPLLEAALAYAARGWPVFPVHGITDGHCTCPLGTACDRPGKHPRIAHGRNAASVDPAQIAAWWHRWPDANVGIATGAESGLLVLDLDDLYAIAESDLPLTPSAVTGRGGRHVLFARPVGPGRWITATNVTAKGVDSRADGGYIVAPPSLHASGRHYTWDVAPDEVPLAPPPAWWAAAIHRTDAPDAPARPVGELGDDLPPDLEALLSAIPSDDYATWRDVGLALAHADPVGGLAWWDWWSARSPKYSAASVRQQWRAMVRRPPVSNPITLHSIRRIACILGYEDPEVLLGAEIAARLIESHQRRIAEALVSAPTSTTVDRPPDLVPTTGLLGEMVEWILETSIYPQPELAVAAGAAFLGALAGRRYRTETDLRTNLYLVGVAPSGAGKDHARKCLRVLATAADCTRFLGGERIASGPGMISALRRHPAQLFLLDEFGLCLGSMTGAGAAPHLRDLMGTMMALYSSASVTYLGTEYADAKERPRVEVIQPHACIYGTTTPDQLYAALTSMQGLDGSLARFLMVHTPDESPTRRRVRLTPPPARLVAAVRDLVAVPAPGGNLAGLGGSVVDTLDPVVAPMTDAVLDAWEALDDAARELAGDNAAGRTIYARVAENAAKLALVAAVARNPGRPVIGPEEFAWGREFALWTANRLVAEVGRRVSDSKIEADTKRVLEVIRRAGKEGISRDKLSRACLFAGRRSFDDYVGMLVQSGLVVDTRRPSAGGRPATVYVYVGAEPTAPTSPLTDKKR